MFHWTVYDAAVIPATFLIICGTGVLLHFILKSAKPFFKKLPLRILAAFMPVAEIAKQIYYAGFAEPDYYILPLHFCSLFIILMPAAQFLPEKAADVFRPVAFAFSLVVAVMIPVNPNSLIGNSTANLFGNFKNAHTFFYHFAIVAYFVFSVCLYDYRPKLIHCINIVACVATYAMYAVPCAYILNTNYVNILYSDFGPLEKFRLWAGQFWYDAVMFVLASGAACLIIIAFYLIDKAVTKTPTGRS